ncbi:1860_t:CDS:1, partial [Gigaspora margarita]
AEFKRTIKNPYELMHLERREVADEDNEKICTSRPKNKNKPWLEMFFEKMNIIDTIVCETI